MRKLRILFVLLAVGLLVPVILLVRRAIESVDLERRMRHQAIAERVFDEMERALSDFLAREEERPFGHYAFSYAPPGQLAGPVAVARSPLAQAPEQPFVVGYFQIDPDGSLHTPLRPRKAEGAAAGTDDWRPSQETLAAIAEIERTVEAYWRGNTAIPSASPQTVTPQLPGTTVEANERPAPESAPAPLAPARARLQVGDEIAAREEVSAYDALRALNKGVEQRAARQSKLSREYLVEKEDAREGIPPVAPGRAGADRAPSLRDDDRAALRGGERAVLRKGDRVALGQHDLATTSAVQGAAPAGTEAPAQETPANEARPNGTERFELSPMSGRVIDARHVLLYRTAVNEAQAYRQGLVLDVERLVTWLREQGVGSDGLADYITLAFSTPFQPAPTAPPRASFLYAHRFAEPFDGLHARLALMALPGVGGARYVYALSALLLVTGTLGFVALYRMVSVAMSFAERRSNFVAAVSHELKTPLTAIRMYGEMLRDGMVSSEAKRDEYHRHITAESERLSRLINNVLEFSQLEKHNRQVSLVTGAIGPVVEEAAELLRPHIERQGFTLGLEVDAALPPVRFERDALLQVIFNLVDNAVKYARDAPARRITVTCVRDGEAVRLAVRDRGPGVAPRHLGKLFEPFYRGEGELTRRSKGAGLGLALVRGLVECMQAQVTGRNVAGGGFEVVILFKGMPVAGGPVPRPA